MIAGATNKNKLFIFLLFGVSVFFADCTNEYIGEEQSTHKSIKRISFDLDDFIDANDTSAYTRSMVWFDNGGTTITTAKWRMYFEHFDSVGIFPDVGDQIPFPFTSIPHGTLELNPNFAVTGWSLRTDIDYYAYYPFSRTNFKDGEDINHINIWYYGQRITKHIGDYNGDVQLQLNSATNDSALSRYSYLYSTPTRAAAGSDNLNFVLKYISGVARFKANCLNMPPNILVDTMKLICMKFTAPDDRFVIEGTYNLRDVATTGVFSITPTMRGRTNTLTVMMDSVPVTKNISTAGVTRGRFHSITFFPPVSLADVTVSVYDQNYNCYQYKISSTSSNNLTSGNTIVYNGANFEYSHTATPDSIKIAPWDETDEIINSNWNYK